MQQEAEQIRGKKIHAPPGMAFEGDGVLVPVTWPESHLEPTTREQFEDRLLNLGVPVSVALQAGCVFYAELELHSTAMAADKLRRFLTLLASTKITKSIEYLAILKLLSPAKSLNEICAGTGHSKQKLYYQVRKMQKFFYDSAISDE